VDAAGNLYVTDNYSFVIRKITPDGTVTTVAGKVGDPGSVDGKGAVVRVGKPRGVAVDRAGNVYVADEAFNTVRKIAADGLVTTIAGNANLDGGAANGVNTNATFFAPRALAVDAKGIIYVADTDNNVIRKITPDGVVTTFAGQAGHAGNTDGQRAAARFNAPRGVAVDKAGNVYVADSQNAAIRKITPDGVVTTLGKTPGPAPTPVK
jgi:sugar lactone lactonase YvrE